MGLDYAAIPPVVVMLGHKPGPELFAQLQVMEYEALEVFARQRNRR